MLPTEIIDVLKEERIRLNTRWHQLTSRLQDVRNEQERLAADMRLIEHALSEVRSRLEGIIQLTGDSE